MNTELRLRENTQSRSIFMLSGFAFRQSRLVYHPIALWYSARIPSAIFSSSSKNLSKIRQGAFPARFLYQLLRFPD